MLISSGILVVIVIKAAVARELARAFAEPLHDLFQNFREKSLSVGLPSQTLY